MTSTATTTSRSGGDKPASGHDDPGSGGDNPASGHDDPGSGGDKPAFGGDKKVGQSILGAAEKRFVDRTVRLVPRFVETHHLTMLTVAWSAGLVAFGWLASTDPRWILGIAAMVIGQYVTDLFDGAVGRHRDTGLVKWGFFMDHFLDFVFAGSFVIALSLLAPAGLGVWFLGLLLATATMMAVSFLSFAATNEFRIAFFGVGPTEVRIGYVALTVLIYTLGVGFLSWAVPVAVIATVGAIVATAYQTHRRLWAIDMAAKIQAEPAVS